MQYQIEKSQLIGSLTVPPSKSHTMRAILLASLAKGKSTIRHYLPSPDTEAMISACTQMGSKIIKNDEVLSIEGTEGQFRVPAQVIDVGNSGQVLRFIAAMAARLPGYTVLTGDHSICHLRPMQPLLEALTQAGALAVSTKGDGHAPVIIKGPIRAGQMVLDGQDSQPVSALLMMAPFLEGQSTIEVRRPGEKPWINLTLHWLDRLNVVYTNRDFEHYTIQGPIRYSGFDYTVPGDWSAAAFPIVAALLTDSEIMLENLDFNDPQGDKAILQALTKMGAQFEMNVVEKKLKILKGTALSGAMIDVNDMIDAVPILATLACFAKGTTTLTGAAIARHKECDRIEAIATELRKMGAQIETLPDGLIIQPSTMRGALTESHHDHRIAMALSIAGMQCGETDVRGTQCVSKSYPGFVKAFQSIGANIREVA